MEVKGGFIDPALVVGKVGAPAVAGFKPAALKPALALHADPSPPHFDEAVGELLDELVPEGAMPLLGDPAADKVNEAQRRYDETLASLRQRFAPPHVASVERVKALLVETSRAANHAFSIANDLFVREDFDADDRARWKSDFWKHVKRLKAYHDELNGLPPQSLETRNVVGGLLEHRIGAGPVPDGIMHLYLANQLDVLATHGLEMRDGMMRALDERLDEIGDQATEVVENVKDRVIETRDQIVETGQRVKWGVVAGITGFVLVVFGTIAYVARGRGSSS